MRPDPHERRALVFGTKGKAQAAEKRISKNLGLPKRGTTEWAKEKKRKGSRNSHWIQHPGDEYLEGVEGYDLKTVDLSWRVEAQP